MEIDTLDAGDACELTGQLAMMTRTLGATADLRALVDGFGIGVGNNTLGDMAGCW